ncbi:MAG: hypothetical protein R2706_03305 [Acidimicrobiales bacterium]
MIEKTEINEINGESVEYFVLKTAHDELTFVGPRRQGRRRRHATANQPRRRRGPSSNSWPRRTPSQQTGLVVSRTTKRS